MLPKLVSHYLQNGVGVIAITASTQPENVAWVSVIQILDMSRKHVGIPLGTKYVVRYIELSNYLLEAYRNGADIPDTLATIYKEIYTANEEELKNILSDYVDDLATLQPSWKTELPESL